MTTILIGIDPGVKTGVGVGVSSSGKSPSAVTVPIHTALLAVGECIESHNGKIYVRVEDARKRKWFGNNSDSKIQGAGSIKRDCKIWEDFLTELKKAFPEKFDFEMVHPIKGATKINPKTFSKITGIEKRTSEHARDAYMLIHGFKPKNSL